MEVQRRIKENQENVDAPKTKSNMVMPIKKPGLRVRGALGDLNTNDLAHRDINCGKVAGAAAEFEKKASLSRGSVKSYGHVQSKIDTGLTSKNLVQPTARPPLRRQESTASHAARAVAHAQASFKEAIKSTEYKELSNNIHVPTKKTESKKNGKPLNVDRNQEVKASKPILKEPTESLGKLKIDEKRTKLSKPKFKVHSPLLPINDTTPELPSDIEDIDDGNDDPLIVSIYIKDIYRYLIELEEKFPIVPDHLKNQISVTGKMRAILIDWLVDVHQQFSLLLETFHLTVAIIDRYLQATPKIQKAQLQLIGVTAMFLASKYEEVYPPDINDFVYVTDMAYSKADLLQCERDIMIKLDFSLGRPIPLSFLRRFVKAARGSLKNHNLAKYFVDLSLIEYSMAHYRPSELAAAAICMSLYLLSTKRLQEVWSPTLSYYSGYTVEQIEPIITKIANIVINVENSKHKAVYNRYLASSLAKVSSFPQLKSKAVYELAKVTVPSAPSP